MKTNKQDRELYRFVSSISIHKSKEIEDFMTINSINFGNTIESNTGMIAGSR